MSYLDSILFRKMQRKRHVTRHLLAILVVMHRFRI